MIDRSWCSWAQYYSRVVEILVLLFLVCATELKPSTRSHRSLFNFQVTHVGYGETWKEKDVVEAYSMKRSHPNYALPGARLKSFTCLDNNKLLSTDLSNENFWCRHTLRSVKISDGWRNIQIPICTSKQMLASDRVATSDIAHRKLFVTRVWMAWKLSIANGFSQTGRSGIERQSMNHDKAGPAVISEKTISYLPKNSMHRTISSVLSIRRQRGVG